MDGGFVPRFAVEIAFLALLALAAGLAELDTPWIVVVMAAGWLLVTLVEWLAWRSEQEEETIGLGPTAREQPVDEPVDTWDLDDILAPLPEGGDDEMPSEPARREDDGA